MSYSLVKLVISIVLVGCYIFLPTFGFPDGGILGHVLYPLCHANVWHLLANLVCVWMIPCEFHLSTTFLSAVLCSFLPCFVSELTVGFSGVLFCVVGMSWGRVRRFRDMIWRNKWFLVIPFFIPHINAFIHVYCMLFGFMWGRLVPMKKSDWL